MPLSQKSFARFGDIIATEFASETRIINEGHTTRFHALAHLDLTANEGQPTLSIFRSSPLPEPLVLSLMERHPLSSQAFFPLGQSPYLIVVAPPGELKPDEIVAFLARPDQGINYHRGTWHHYSLALNKTSDFLVADRDSTDENCDEIRLNETDSIEIDLEGLV